MESDSLHSLELALVLLPLAADAEEPPVRPMSPSREPSLPLVAEDVEED